jgi:L-malate glycosyltransferase
MTSGKKLHIIHVTQTLYLGGLETFILEFCKHIDRNMYNVSVLCFNGYDEKHKEYLEAHGVPIYLITKQGRYDFRFFFRAAAFLKEKKVDIMHTHGGCFFYSSIVGKLAGIRSMVYTAHGMPIVSGFQIRIEDMLSCFLTDSIIAVSNEVADDMKSRLKAFTRKIEVIINGIDTDKFRSIADMTAMTERRKVYGLPQQRKIVGSVGRLENVKNYTMLLRAFAKVIQFYGNDAHLVLVGNGSEEENLKKFANELKIGERVSFLGLRYDLPDIYPLFDLFTLSSLTEGTSLSLLEAQSCGVPAIVTEVGGNSSIIKDGVNGFLCASGDHDTMAAKIHQLLNNDAERLKMKISAREKILTEFDMNSMMKKYLQVYHDCLQS